MLVRLCGLRMERHKRQRLWQEDALRGRRNDVEILEYIPIACRHLILSTAMVMMVLLFIAVMAMRNVRMHPCAVLMNHQRCRGQSRSGVRQQQEARDENWGMAAQAHRTN